MNRRTRPQKEGIPNETKQAWGTRQPRAVDVHKGEPDTDWRRQGFSKLVDPKPEGPDIKADPREQRWTWSPARAYLNPNALVSTPLKNISQLGLLFPIYGKIKNVPNHQPENIDSFHVHMVLAKNSTCEKKTSKSASELYAKVDSCSPVILDNSSNVT